MKKPLKKLTIVATSAFLFCLTIVSGTVSTLPAVSIEAEEDVTISPLADDDMDFDSGKDY